MTDHEREMFTRERINLLGRKKVLERTSEALCKLTVFDKDAFVDIIELAPSFAKEVVHYHDAWKTRCDAIASEYTIVVEKIASLERLLDINLSGEQCKVIGR